jgi:cation-transporting P-type ATPase E
VLAGGSDVRSSTLAPEGLTAQEAAQRLARQPRRTRAAGSRSYLEIAATNVLTLFNAILAALLAVVVVVGDYRDALFGGVLISNIAIGIVQEVRAKRTLDRLALLVAPRARTYRDGVLIELPADALVPGDVVRLEPGDQVVADGRIVAARTLSLDESILTGESDPAERAPGDQVLSGAFCVAGAGAYLVEAVGANRYAERLAVEARGTRAQLSPLQLDINRILRATVAIMLPLAAALIAVLAWRDTPIDEAGRTAVAALLPLVPEGLVLLMSLTIAVAAVRLARLGLLAQRLNAVESLASVDVVCLDKTGTLTDNRLRIVGFEPAAGASDADLRALLGAFAASAAARNGTLQALHDEVAAQAEQVVAEVAFTSERKWSGLSLAGRETMVLGAPDVLARQGVRLDASLEHRLASHSADRRRTVLLATSSASFVGDALPTGLVARGIAVLEDGLREDAGATIAFLTREGVDVKVISGDGLPTVQAIAGAVGVPHADRGIVGSDLPVDLDELGRAAETHAVFGRITPEQKRALVQALTRSGRYVAMIGDGVNDVLALKEARLAIAMGNGSQMAKGVADLVLLTNDFATVPVAIGEGRRILRNVHRVARLFVTKTAYAALLVAGIGLAPISYLFLPRQVTVISTLSVGLPAFFLALAPSEGPVRRDAFARNLVRFSVPTGVVVATTVALAYLIARGPLDRSLAESRTVATAVTLILGLAVVIAVERDAEAGRVRWWVWAITAGALCIAIAGVSLAPLRSFFEVTQPDRADWALIVIAALAGGWLANVAACWAARSSR